MTSSLLAPEIAQRLAGSLLQFIWQGAAIAFLTAVGMKLLRRRSAESRYTVGVAALALMLVAPVVTFVFYAQTGAAALALLRTARHFVSGSAQSSAFASGTAAWTQRILIVWLVGVSAFLLRLVMGWHLSRRLIRFSDGIVPAGIQQMFDQLKAHLALTGIVRLLVHARIDSPIVVGWLRPVVILPISAITGLNEDQVMAVLAHELAHIRRRDFLVNILQRCVEAILFYHPAVWWLSKRVRIERENCCDDLAVNICGDRKMYAEALIRLERGRHDAAPALAVAATGSGTIKRVQRILGLESSGADWQPAVVALVLVLAWISTGLWQPTTVHAQVRAPRVSVTPAIVAAQTRTVTTPPSSPLGAIAAIITAQPVQPEELQQAPPTTPAEQTDPVTLTDRLDVNVRDVSLRTLLSNLVQTSGLNLSMAPDIDTKITVNLSQTTLRDALQAILAPLDLKYEIEGKILTVYKEKPIQKIFAFDYVNAQRSASSTQSTNVMADLSAILTNVVTGPGSSFYLDKMTGIIIVTALPSKMAAIQSIIDVYQNNVNRQVVITAHFIEVQLDDTQKDINWNSAAGVAGTRSTSSPTPTQVMASHTNALTVLQNLRAQGKVNILSIQQVSALNHQQAVIRDGAQDVFFQTTTQVDPRSGALLQTAAAVQEGIALRVTPTIFDSGMGMNVIQTVTERTGTATSPNGDTRPLTNVRETNTILRVADGDTIILSGLVPTGTSNDKQGVPDLNNLPVIGRFFANKAGTVSKTQFIILLTPEIITTK